MNDKLCCRPSKFNLIEGGPARESSAKAVQICGQGEDEKLKPVVVRGRLPTPTPDANRRGPVWFVAKHLQLKEIGPFGVILAHLVSYDLSAGTGEAVQLLGKVPKLVVVPIKRKGRCSFAIGKGQAIG